MITVHLVFEPLSDGSITTNVVVTDGEAILTLHPTTHLNAIALATIFREAIASHTVDDVE
jgi:hypothetical protein